MSGAIESGSPGGRGRTSQDFDLNLAPIIDSFTVLIAFMLVSASFLSIGIMDAGVAAGGAAVTSAAPPAVNLTVEIATGNRIMMKLTGKSEEKFQLAARSGQYDLEGVGERLAALRKKWPDLNAVTLVSDNNVQYRDVIQVMESLRKGVPAVLLGGF